VLEPIVIQSKGYEARTDGRALEVRLANGVIVGEGRIGLEDGSFCVGEYTGSLDERVFAALEELLREHETDIVARWLAASNRGAQA
jgi:hypothetical protein